jgi:hypothetical protein
MSKTTLTDPISGKTVKWSYKKGFILTKQLGEACLHGTHGEECHRYHNNLIKLFSFEDTLKRACVCDCHWVDGWTPKEGN